MGSPGKLLVYGFVALIVIASFNAMFSFLDERAASKAAVDEFWRREHLSPEQRIAENKAKAAAEKQAAENLRAANAQAEKTKIEAMGRATCLAWWEKSLKDPDSAKIEETGGVLAENTYYGQISGRAKNSFGGYVRGTWDCQLLWDGKHMTPLVLSERKR